MLKLKTKDKLMNDGFAKYGQDSVLCCDCFKPEKFCTCEDDEIAESKNDYQAWLDANYQDLRGC